MKRIATSLIALLLLANAALLVVHIVPPAFSLSHYLSGDHGHILGDTTGRHQHPYALDPHVHHDPTFPNHGHPRYATIWHIHKP